VHLLGSIVILPADVSSKIAAGEVIEGPYSVVRELVDNAVDAGADRIDITVNNGGKDFIRVTDNGSGMTEEDAALCVQKHTTSKIAKFEDLDTLSTMGFRGEALASICAVSDFALITQRNGNARGTKVHCSFGEEREISPAAANRGTDVTVRNLFFNVPARRKFLKSNRSESARIKDEVIKKALGFHRVAFSLTSDDRKIFRLIPQADTPARIAEIFGNDLGESLSEHSETEEFFSLHVFISDRSHTLSNRRGQYIFVNRRPVIDRSLFFALNNPGRGIVQAGRYVYAFVYIDVKPAFIDVNVHPAKREIKLKMEKKIVSSLHSTVENLLRTKFYPAGYEPETHPAERVREKYSTVQSGFIQSLLSGSDVPSVFHAQAEVREGVRDGLYQGTEEGVEKKKAADFSFDNVLYRCTLFKMYVIFEGKDFILLVDQHAAHERILYERFKKSMGDPPPLKRLLIPMNISPPRSKYDEVFRNIESFHKVGIEIEPFGDESFNVVAIPAVVPDGHEEDAIAQLFNDLYEGKLSPDAVELRERFLKLLSCRNAIMEGQTLKEEEARALLKDLLATDIPYVCPHGRPTHVRVSLDYFDKTFKRR
jgi:DNA mismatch repair protein MutL